MKSQLIYIDGLPVKLTRKRMKNVRIHVKDASGTVEVSAPLHMPLAEIKRFVSSKRTWITRAQARLENSIASQAERATDKEKSEWKAIVSACTPPLIEQWESIMGVHASKLVYRNMKSRWGSCQPSTGRICINTRLALYPPECLEYVVVHELCHLKERGHGPRFHALMDEYMPDWKARRKKLRDL